MEIPMEREDLEKAVKALSKIENVREEGQYGPLSMKEVKELLERLEEQVKRFPWEFDIEKIVVPLRKEEIQVLHHLLVCEAINELKETGQIMAMLDENETYKLAASLKSYI